MRVAPFILEGDLHIRKCPLTLSRRLNEDDLLQLSTGLSSEYIEAQDSDTARAADIAQADRDVCAKYYVQQILSLDEESIQEAWNKVSETCCSFINDK